MLDKLRSMEKRFSELEEKIQDPAIMGNGPLYASLLRERGTLQKNVEAYRRYTKAHAELEEAQAALKGAETDADMLDMYRAELPLLQQRDEAAFKNLVEQVLTEDEDSSRDCIIEIRAGTGGEEAALFVADMYKMYSNYAGRRGWTIEVLESSPAEAGGLKEIVFGIKGRDVYQVMRWEAGTHRVQRVPATETKGRIHTSAITVAVLPEVEDVEVEVKESDLRIDTYCASGAGGQHVNKTASAVRLTHLPTGIVVACQDERSQHKNKARAMRILRSRIYERRQMERKAKEDSLRKTMVGSGDRSEKIRTYNYPQSRVTDHRINQSFFSFDNIMAGDMQEISDALLHVFKEEQLGQFRLSSASSAKAAS